MKPPITHRGPCASIGAVAKDIIAMKVADGDTSVVLLRRFYAIMRRHGIKQGTKNANGTGRICDNFEWTGAKAIFNEHVEQERFFHPALIRVPKDLECY